MRRQDVRVALTEDFDLTGAAVWHGVQGYGWMTHFARKRRRYFDIEALFAHQNWRLLFWPGQFYCGLGLGKLWTPWFVSPFRPIRDVAGCWGQTGAFLFHRAATGLHFAGTVSQVSGRGHASAVRAMLRLIKATQA